jgi:hypothetical protein
VVGVRCDKARRQIDAQDGGAQVLEVQILPPELLAVLTPQAGAKTVDNLVARGRVDRHGCHTLSVRRALPNVQLVEVCEERSRVWRVAQAEGQNQHEQAYDAHPAQATVGAD